MIKVSILYPNVEGTKFDMDYYCNQHIPMVKEKLGEKCKGVSVDQGLSGAEPGSEVKYIAMAHLLFDSVDAFISSYGPHSEEIAADIANYTDVEPVIQISEIMLL